MCLFLKCVLCSTPLGEILHRTGHMLQRVGVQTAEYELSVHQALNDAELTELVNKEFGQVEREIKELERKTGQYTNAKHKYEREKKKYDGAQNDPEWEKELEVSWLSTVVGADLIYLL